MVAARQRRRRPFGARARRTPREQVVPYDYAARFDLTGQPGRLVQDVISISADGIFVAVAIGYGFEEDRARDIEKSEMKLRVPPDSRKPGDITLGELPPSALIEGFRLNPRLEAFLFTNQQDPAQTTRGGRVRDRQLSDQEVSADSAYQLFQRVKARSELSFLFSVVDTGTGRELQDEPTHNLASLGKSNGERPFRLLPSPLSFLPRSTLRLQVIERSADVRGTLFIVLYGYRILSQAACPEPVTRSLTGPPVCPTETIGSPSSRVIPFDYVVTLQLTGRPRNLLEQGVNINAESGFVATALGYGLAVDDLSVKLKPSPGPKIDLTQVPLRLFPTDVLEEGFRIRPSLVRLAFEDNGGLARSLPLDLVDRLFERLNRPEDVSFRYTIFDGGRGIELQNQPINNVAGLGIANGDRPFKSFARPMIFLPRSNIRVSIEERFGRGTLFLVFQGYKLLEPASTARRK